jgi:hypothetical protein
MSLIQALIGGDECMSFQRLSTNIGRNTIPTLVVDHAGEMTGLTNREQKLLTKLIQLSKQLPVFVMISGVRSNPRPLLSISSDHLEVYDLDAPAPRVHVMATLSSPLSNGSTGLTLIDLKLVEGGRAIDIFR